MRKNINSVRTFKLLWDSHGETIELEVTLDDIFEKGENENDFEYNYALQDDIDKVLDMKVEEIINFQFNRDDNREKGIIKRIK